jgi:hypothetical protein
MGTPAFENERWRIADHTAAFLSVDRDVCRRAFYGETLNLISKVVECVRSWENDPERMIEDWARDESAGVFDEDRRYRSDLTHVEKIASGEFLRLAFERPELDHKNDYHLYLVCVRIQEERVGRELTTSELARFTQRFYAPSYRRNLDKIPQEQWDELNLELEHEEPRTHQKRLPRRKAS